MKEIINEDTVIKYEPEELIVKDIEHYSDEIKNSNKGIKICSIVTVVSTALLFAASSNIDLCGTLKTPIEGLCAYATGASIVGFCYGLGGVFLNLGWKKKDKRSLDERYAMRLGIDLASIKGIDLPAYKSACEAMNKHDLRQVETIINKVKLENSQNIDLEEEYTKKN